MDNRYDILKSISQREDREMPEENVLLVHIADDIRRAAESSRTNEEKSANCTFDVNESEKRAAEQWAKEHNSWIPITKVFELGLPGPTVIWRL